MTRKKWADHWIGSVRSELEGYNSLLLMRLLKRDRLGNILSVRRRAAMKKIIHLILLMAMGLVFPVLADNEDRQSSLTLYAAYETVRPGDDLPLAVRITVDEGWHTYAREPGDSGMPPSIQVTGPEGIKTSTWQFPPPQTFIDSVGTTYGYEHEVILRGSVRIPETLPIGIPIDLTISSQWMICKDICVFLTDTAVLTIQTGEESSEPSIRWKVLIDETKTGN
jgi:DsbC/DsbD-like thiol-disulfide interchange protein